MELRHHLLPRSGNESVYECGTEVEIWVLRMSDESERVRS